MKGSHKIMKPENYFKKNKCIYGISYKYEFSEWRGYSTKFYDLKKAYDWLYMEEYDFRTRELASKTKAKEYSFIPNWQL